MDKKERLNNIYAQLVEAGVCRSKKEFAVLLGVGYNGLARAMNGDPQTLTDSLVSKAVAFSSSAGDPTTPASDFVPVLPLGARAGTIQDWSDAVHDYDCERIVSPIRGAEFAAQVTGDSM